MNREITHLFLMANLGAEVSRMISARKDGEKELLNSAYLRAQNILKDIRKDPKMKDRMKEINILDETIKKLNKDDNFPISFDNLKNYFKPFAIRLMSG